MTDLDYETQLINEKPTKQFEDEKSKKYGLWASIATTALSIPALIGGWCWPAIVLPLLDISISTAARHTAHLVTLLLDIVLIGALAVYVTYRAKSRSANPSWFQKWGPTILVWAALPLICADPFRHVLSDNDIWKSCERRCGELWPDRCLTSSNEYQCQLPCYSTTGDPTSCDSNKSKTISCTCVHDRQENWGHLSPIGVLFTLVFTYIGYFLFIVGALWSGDILDKCRKIRDQYKELRSLEKPDDELQETSLEIDQEL